ncbi:hypothetical protein OPT61_g7367 [Boeremia exigua]|uniref:Uncharacterized protein n=1 Tax=Boeremia exigua TaxID=749465 RepID=A0ACC2I2I7_9PLEO|nr:hypothetical protein OPT61_g7367 [Boeremia exigua]
MLAYFGPSLGYRVPLDCRTLLLNPLQHHSHAPPDIPTLANQILFHDPLQSKNSFHYEVLWACIDSTWETAYKFQQQEPEVEGQASSGRMPAVTRGNMSHLLGFGRNISYFTIPPALIFALIPRFYSGLSGPGAKLFDRNNPRGFPETLKNADLDEDLRGRLLRAEACSANGFETLPLFAAAVTAGNAAGVSAVIMNTLTVVWLASRLVYTYVYIWQSGTEKLAPGQAPLRFKVWSVGAMIYTMQTTIALAMLATLAQAGLIPIIPPIERRDKLFDSTMNISAGQNTTQTNPQSVMNYSTAAWRAYVAFLAIGIIVAILMLPAVFSADIMCWYGSRRLRQKQKETKQRKNDLDIGQARLREMHKPETAHLRTERCR